MELQALLLTSGLSFDVLDWPWLGKCPRWLFEMVVVYQLSLSCLYALKMAALFIMNSRRRNIGMKNCDVSSNIDGMEMKMRLMMIT